MQTGTTVLVLLYIAPYSTCEVEESSAVQPLYQPLEVVPGELERRWVLPHQLMDFDKI